MHFATESGGFCDNSAMHDDTTSDAKDRPPNRGNARRFRVMDWVCGYA